MGKRKRTPVYKSPTCTLVTLGVSFNIADEEELLDFQFVEKWADANKFSKKMKEMIRARRTGTVGYAPIEPVSTVEDEFEFDEGNMDIF